MNIRKSKWVLAFIRAVVIVFLPRGFAFTSYLVPSTGTENPIFQGERILVSRWSYGLRVPFMPLFSYHRWCENPVRQQDIAVFNNPAGIRESVIGHREIHISRRLGAPGSTLLVDSPFSAISPKARFNPDKKRPYSCLTLKENLTTSFIHIPSITNDGLTGSNDSTHVRSFSRYEYYLSEQAMNGKEGFVQPLPNRGDTESDPLIVPGKEKFIRVYPWNIILLWNTLMMHEGKQAEIKDDTLYVDGKPTQYCYFTEDYYWVGSSSTVNFLNSRLFGLIPQDHIIGKALIIWFPKGKETGLFDGCRWSHFFRAVE